MKKVQKDRIINSKTVKITKIIKKKIKQKITNYWKELKVQTFHVITNKQEKMPYN